MPTQWTRTACLGFTASLMLLGTVTAAGATVPPTQISNSFKTSQATEGQVTEGQVTEGQIRDIVEKMQAASNSQDIEGIIQHLAPNAVVEVTIYAAFADTQKLRLSRDEYRDYLKQGFAMIRNYKSQLSNLKIQIAPNGKFAVATCKVLEETTLKEQGFALKSVSNEAVRFEMIDGQILATRIRAVSKIEIK